MSRPCSSLLVGVLLTSLAQAAPLNLASLLTEMVDRDAVARFPEPAYTCRQFSSYDRASKTPDDPKGWFANNDFNQFLRTETNGGRKEWVLMDIDGPGAIVRLWSANPPKCNLRFYFDGAPEAGWTVDFQALTGGKGLLASPLSQVSGRGWNSYLPIPYAKHCKLTSDRDGYYYQVNYRTYDPTVAVETFTPGAFDAAKAQVADVQARLLAAAPGAANRTEKVDGTLETNGALALALPAGPAAVRELTFQVTADDLEQALRSTIVGATFDGEECVWAPLGDFLGSGVGANAYQDWYRTVAKDGTLSCRWVMPYETSGKLTLTNLGAAKVQLSVRAGVGAWTWDARSLHFRANWRDEYPLPTQPRRDWNYLTAEGQGVYVGDSLAVFNPVPAWWGEGDEKIYVDGEKFPSHFGTGSEDYYGYAWCDPHYFTHPFHAQSRIDGPGNAGHTAVTRSRSLDAIPFHSKLQMDMEVWHWANTKISFSATTYWYARPGVKHNRVPQPEEAKRAILKMPPRKTLAGAIEAEGLKVLGKSAGLPVEAQDMGGFAGEWSGGRQLFARGQKVGDWLEIEVPTKATAPQKLTIWLTKSYDYGILKLTVNGQPALAAQDTWANEVTNSGPLELGTFAPVDGGYKLRVEVIGKNPAARGSGAFFGIDALTAK